MNSESTLLAPKEVARQLGVSPVTVRLWAQENKLPFTVTAGGHRRFLQEDVDAFHHAHNTEKYRPLSIVIVDDDKLHVELLKTIIENIDRPSTIHVAHDGFEAGQLITQQQPDIVLLDLKMPGLDGFSVCQRIKQNPQQQSIRIIAITGFADPDNVERILAAGAEQCLSKPIQIQTITQLISA